MKRPSPSGAVFRASCRPLSPSCICRGGTGVEPPSCSVKPRQAAAARNPDLGLDLDSLCAVIQRRLELLQLDGDPESCTVPLLRNSV